MTESDKNCSLDGCPGEVHARGYCDKHYRRLLKTGSPTPAKPPAQVGGGCSIPKCKRKHYAKTLCHLHYFRQREGREMNAPIRGDAPPGQWGKWYGINKGYVVRRRTNPETGKAEYQSRHRYEMEKSLGRKLLRSETVHHIDLDRANNAISNLQLRQGNHGRGAKFECFDCGGHNVRAVKLD